ncbi:hypothetical protein [Streptomyces pakalii]|uniref:Secreted protein n=1 Tax=Streptomyces pakalii TaxID=3036494 RepID=A0ABT7D3A7_9ACTN|nr:hypothetical protein [Streptomyces pakalii]MDJ1640023.1 hypothetical protein [Streptomyces pakalii]
MRAYFPKAVATVGGLVLTAGFLASAPASATSSGQQTSAQEQQAKACRDYAKSYTKAKGKKNSGTATTGRRCADIQIKIGGSKKRKVRACLKPSSGGTKCGGFKTAKPGEWKNLRKNVADGTKFYFNFASKAYSKGKWAA